MNEFSLRINFFNSNLNYTDNVLLLDTSPREFTLLSKLSTHDIRVSSSNHNRLVNLTSLMVKNLCPKQDYHAKVSLILFTEQETFTTTSLSQKLMLLEQCKTNQSPADL